MLKVDDKTLDEMESKYPGIKSMIFKREEKQMPKCWHCDSSDTAKVEVGLVGYSINIAAATSKVHLMANGPRDGDYYCNTCGKYFDVK